MASLPHPQGHRDEPQIPGVPGHHKLGASRNEMLALALAVLVLAAIGLSFWLSATP